MHIEKCYFQNNVEIIKPGSRRFFPVECDLYVDGVLKLGRTDEETINKVITKLMEKEGHDTSC